MEIFYLQKQGLVEIEVLYWFMNLKFAILTRNCERFSHLFPNSAGMSRLKSV